MKDHETHIAASLAAGQIAYQRCPNCGGVQAIARPFCVHCLHPEPEWCLASGRGTLVACSTLHRAPTPEWKARLPYAIALVDLDEGVRVMALAAGALSPGATVTLRPGGLHDLPCFEPTVRA